MLRCICAIILSIVAWNEVQSFVIPSNRVILSQHLRPSFTFVNKHHYNWHHHTASSKRNKQKSIPSSDSFLQNVSNDEYVDEGKANRRRDILRKMVFFPLASAICSIDSWVLHPKQVLAADKKNKSKQPEPKPSLLSTEEVTARLRGVPTFAIVDKRGTPFMVFGEDAKVTGYFFTSYGEAQRILALAIKSSDQARIRGKEELIAKKKAAGEKNPQKLSDEDEKELGDNPWREARISTVPLDVAVLLARKTRYKSSGGIYFKLAPAETDIYDALATTGRGDLPEGQVPLFYFEELVLSPRTSPSEKDSSGTDIKVSPVYFRKSELLNEYKKQFGKDADYPALKVTELSAVVAEMTRPGETNEDIKSVYFMAPEGSEQAVKECINKGGKEDSFKFGERIVVL